MASILEETEKIIKSDEVLLFLQNEQVPLNNSQIKTINEMHLSMEDLSNMNIETDFIEFCKELKLSFAPKIKLKSAIIKLQKTKINIASSQLDNIKLELLISMGFDRQNAQKALNMNDNHLKNAVTALINTHPNEKNNDENKEQSSPNSDKTKLEILISMGFDKNDSITALNMNNNDITKSAQSLTNAKISNLSSNSISEIEIHNIKHENITVALIGNSGVGKSSILTRFMDNTFDDQRVATLGVDNRQTDLNIIDTKVKLTVLDTAGQERFGSIANWYYRVSHAFIIIYDITDKQSFIDLKKWIEKLNDKASDIAKRFIVGTKIDLEKKRMVSFDEAMTFSKSYQFRYCEVSAKSGRNINQLFTTVTLYVLKDNIVEQMTGHKYGAENRVNVADECVHVKTTKTVNTGCCNNTIRPEKYIYNAMLDVDVFENKQCRKLVSNVNGNVVSGLAGCGDRVISHGDFLADCSNKYSMVKDIPQHLQRSYPIKRKINESNFNRIKGSDTAVGSLSQQPIALQYTHQKNVLKVLQSSDQFGSVN